MLKGTHIKLRALEPEDADLLYEWENDTAIWNVSNTLKPFSLNLIRSYIESEHLDIYESKQLRLMVQLFEEPYSTIGIVDLFDFDPYNRRAGVGIMVHKDYRSNGYAADALNILSDYAFNHLNLHQLHCIISEKNIISVELFKKSGFNVVGLQKDWSFNGTEFENVLFLQKIRNYNKQ